MSEASFIRTLPPMKRMLQPDEIVPFVRGQKYRFVKYIGRGALGATVLLRDDILEMDLVCKKYSPQNPAHQDEFFSNFLREMKLMYNVYHESVVRVYTCIPYPNEKVGFILMEYINGAPIDEYVSANPGSTILESLFRQAIDGFQYLENAGILHRDIRMSNILVTVDGVLKIIDLGFGKQVEFPGEFDKSISLAWPFTTPKEFLQRRYDFSTEVYFVGKLFESLLVDTGVGTFGYSEILDKMTCLEPADRFQSFNDVARALAEGELSEGNFSEEALRTYQAFAEFLSSFVTRISSDMKYVETPENVIADLQRVYESSVLETEVQAPTKLVLCFLTGGEFYSHLREPCYVEDVKNFLNFIKAQSQERQVIILRNIWMRLDGVERYFKSDEDIPF